jgi:hypothetical protein
MKMLHSMPLPEGKLSMTPRKKSRGLKELHIDGLGSGCHPERSEGSFQIDSETSSE